LRGPEDAPFTWANSMVNLRRVIVGFYFVLFLGVGLTAGVIFLQARGEYDQLKQQEAASRRRLAESEARLREQERIIDRLRNDPAYVEKVIRRRLNYAKPDEFIFRFDD
jgi:cell division protein DivIC